MARFYDFTVTRLRLWGAALGVALCCSCAGDDQASGSETSSESAASAATASSEGSGTGGSGASASGGSLSDGSASDGSASDGSASDGSASDGSASGGSGGEVAKTGVAGASVHYYYYEGKGMLQCPGRIAGYDTQEACDDLGKSQTENGPINQVGLSCDGDPEGCIVGDRLMVTATDRCPESPRFVRVTYKSNTVTVRIVDRTPGNGGFDLGLDPYVDLGIYDDFMIGVSGPEDIAYECLI